LILETEIWGIRVVTKKFFKSPLHYPSRTPNQSQKTRLVCLRCKLN